MTLKIKTETVHYVDSSDLEKFIAEQFNIPGVEIMEASNDSTHPVDVEDLTYEDSNSWKAKNMHKTLEAVRRGRYVSIYEIGAIMNQMCTLDMIPSGRYVVLVSW